MVEKVQVPCRSGWAAGARGTCRSAPIRVPAITTTPSDVATCRRYLTSSACWSPRAPSYARHSLGRGTWNRCSVEESIGFDILRSSMTSQTAPHSHGHSHAHRRRRTCRERRWRRRSSLTLGFVVVEAVGWFAHSLALLSDAGHNLADAAALASAGTRCDCEANRRTGMTFGYHRVGVFAALVNAVSLVAIAVLIGWEAIGRIRAAATGERRADDRRGHRGDRRQPGDRLVAAPGLEGRPEHPQRLSPHDRATPFRRSASSSPACWSSTIG